MKSYTTKGFRDLYNELPSKINRQARSAFRQWLENPWHPGLQFKHIQGAGSVYSARISLGYRALAIKSGEDYIWFWIGSHSDYDKVTANL